MSIMDEFHPFNDLSVGEAERLALLLEEAGEVVQAVGKILRHGYESYHPDGGPSNRESLERELGDMAAAIQMMTERRDLNTAFIKQCQREKMVKVAKYLHHQEPA
jgi:NTP pyrophosphatase (non-canonical NTP hydrolase)